jgi:hypothetical protein
MKPAQEQLRQLAEALHHCATLEPVVTTAALHAAWSGLRRLDPEHGDDVTGAMLVALILHDEDSCAGLVTEEQLDQLHDLAEHARERYELAIKPKNPIGRLLTAALKKEEE